MWTRNLWVVALLLAVSMGGCFAEDTPDPGPAGTDPGGEANDAAGADDPENHPEDYQVRTSITSIGNAGVDETWTWQVDHAGYATMVVEVVVEGPSEVPQYTSNGLVVEFEHPGGVQRTGGGLTSSSDQTIVDYDGANGANSVGSFRLHVEGGPGLYEVRVLIDLTY